MVDVLAPKDHEAAVLTTLVHISRNTPFRVGLMLSEIVTESEVVLPNSFVSVSVIEKVSESTFKKTRDFENTSVSVTVSERVLPVDRVIVSLGVIESE